MMLHRTLAILTLLLAPLATAAPPATTQATPDQIFEELRKQTRIEFLQQQEGSPDLGEKRLQDFVELKREGDNLRLDLKCEPTGEPVGFTLTPGNLPGRADIRASEQYVSADIQVADFSKPGEISRRTSITLNPLAVSIACFVHHSLGSYSIQCFQTREGDRYLVRLIVNEESDFSAPFDWTGEAATFTELRRRYGREVQKYLAPVVRDLGIEQAIFAPPLALAQQVLGIGAEIDANALEELEPLLAKLESTDFRTRHGATQELKKLDAAKVLALSRADRSKWSLDRAAAVDALLAETDLPAQADLANLSREPLFLIDCLYLDDPAVRKAAAAALESLAKRPLNISNDEPLHRRVGTIDRLIELFIPPTRIDPDQ